MQPYGPLLPTRRWPIWLRYLLTIILTGIVVVLQAFWYEAAQYPFLFFLCIIIICAALFDHFSSLLATGLAGGIMGFFALHPDRAFSPAAAPDLVAWGIFMVVGLVSGGMVEMLHKALDDLHRSVDALAASEREKDLLLQELAHRTRNELARLIGLIKMEEQSAKDDPKLRDHLRRIADRIHVFARLQNRLSRSNELAVVQMREFIDDLCRDVQSSLVSVRPIAVEAQADARPVAEPTAVVLGLIANELLTNAMKHAFPGSRAGKVQVTFRSREGECILCVEDDGVGMPVEEQQAQDGHGLGQKLIRSLANQLQGSYEICRRRDGSGTIASVRFPAR